MARSSSKRTNSKRGRRPGPVIAERIARFREQMARAKLPAFFVSNRADQIYLTGFTGEDGGVLVTPRQVYLLTDGRFDEAADIEAPWARKVLRKKSVIDELSKLVKKSKASRVAVQPEYLSLAVSQRIREAIHPVRLVPGKPIIRAMRECKDAQELDVMLRAIRVAQLAIKKAVRDIRIGQTERELAARIEYEMQLGGATGASFPTIVAEGPNASLPHAVPGDRRIGDGSAVLIDWGARVDHYCSDLTRVIFINRIPPKIGRIYDIVLEAQEKAIAAVRPGARLCDVDAAARRHIKSAGYGRNFGHGLGHGLGLDVHESPRVHFQSKDRLEPGMVVTIEPGIYLPGVGGVRIEDDVLVTEDGHQVLSDLPKRREQMVFSPVT